MHSIVLRLIVFHLFFNELHGSSAAIDFSLIHSSLDSIVVARWLTVSQVKAF